MKLTPKVNIDTAMLSFACDEANTLPINALADLTAVGKDKPLGYIPIESLNSYYKVDIAKLKCLLENAGIHTLIMASSHHCGESLFFAYDAIELGRVLKENESTLIAFGWTADLDDFIVRINQQWIETEEDVYDVIALAFGANFLLEAKYN